MGIFPNEASPTNLLRADVLERHEIWQFEVPLAPIQSVHNFIPPKEGKLKRRNQDFEITNTQLLKLLDVYPA